MTSFLLPLVIQGALLPFAVAVATLLALRRRSRRKQAAPLAVVFAMLAAYLAVHREQWSLFPRQALDWLPWIGVVGLAIGLLARDIGGAAKRVCIGLVLGAGAAFLVLIPVLGSLDGYWIGSVILGSAVMTAFGWLCLADAGEPYVSPVVLAIVAGAAGLAVLVDASQSVGQLLGALAMTCIAVLLISLRVRSVFFNQATVVVALGYLAALLVTAHVYAEFSLVSLALLITGLLAARVPALLRASGRSPNVIRVIGAAALAAAVPVLIVLVRVLREAQEYGY